MDEFHRNLPLIKPLLVPGVSRVGLILLIAGFMAPGVASAATLTVDSSADVIADDRVCTLREAIINANNNDQSGSADCLAGEALPVTDQIVFDAATNSSPFVLNRTGTNENAAATGDLDITESLMITGNGADSVTEVDGNATDRVFEIREGAEVEMSRIAITNGGGVVDGAGIKVFNGRLELTDAGVFSNSISGGPGFGALTGAGIQSMDELSLTSVSVLGNDIQGTGNASGFGAGIHIGTGGTLSVFDSLIRENTIDTVDGSANGAGVYHHPADAGAFTVIRNTILSGNRAATTGSGSAAGGGINHQSGTLEITRTLFRNNSLAKTSDADSSVATGGAVNAFSPVEIANATFSGNRSESVGSAWGGGLALSGSGVLNNVTITDNQVISGPGKSTFGGGLSGNSAVSLSNTIVAGNSTTSNSQPDCSGAIDSMGYNLIGDISTCGFVAGTGDLVGDASGGGQAIDPMLDALADNGGAIDIDGTVLAMESHTPQAGSPAIDAGDANIPGSGGTCEVEDQRGESRPADGDDDGSDVCDIGAVEKQGTPATGPGDGDDSDNNNSGGGSSGGAMTVLYPLFLIVLLGRRWQVRPSRLSHSHRLPS